MKPKEPLADKEARQVILDEAGGATTELDAVTQWGHVYSSLPLMRVTVVREPFR